MFILILALYDASSRQKISENFYWIPHYEAFLGNGSGSERKTAAAAAAAADSRRNSSISVKRLLQHSSTSAPPPLPPPQLPSQSAESVFTLDGQSVASECPQSLLLADMAPRVNALLNEATSALFHVADTSVHEATYLVVRIEKLLNGSSILASIQPYLHMQAKATEASAACHMRLAKKFKKKLDQLLRTKLASYRQPFAWTARPLYRRAVNARTKSVAYELDDTQRPFHIYAQDEQTLSDDDLFKLLEDATRCNQHQANAATFGSLSSGATMRDANQRQYYSSKFTQLPGQIKLALLESELTIQLFVKNNNTSNY